jgi:hypothetical protein
MFLLYGDTNVDWFQNFQHFMDENVSLLGHYILNNMDCPIQIPEITGSKGIPYYNSTMKEILKVLELEDRVQLVEYRKPEITEPMWQITQNKITFYKTFRSKLPNFESSPSKIYIKRTWGQPISGEIGGHPQPLRAIVNDDEVQTFLESKGFITIVFENTSFEEKKKLLQHAKVIVTQTGANCTNLFLCEDVEKIIFLTNDMFRMSGYFANLCVALNQRNITALEFNFESIDRHLLTGQLGTLYGPDSGNFKVLTHVIEPDL